MPKTPEPMAGEIWDLYFDPSVGREQSGRRPGLVVSNDEFNQTPNGLHLVVPVTGIDRGVRIHLPIEPPEGGLSKPSVIMCDQVRSLSVLRFKRRRGVVSPALLKQVQELVGMVIDR
jgi:mRNA interferase MazF